MVCLLNCMPEERRKNVNGVFEGGYGCFGEGSRLPAVFVRVFSTCITCNVNRSSQGMWHHAVLSNRFWILYSWSEIEKKQMKTFGTEATLHFGFESCKVKE